MSTQNIIRLLGLFCVVFLLQTKQDAIGASPQQARYVPGEVLVQTASELVTTTNQPSGAKAAPAIQESLRSLASKHNLKSVRRIDQPPALQKNRAKGKVAGVPPMYVLHFDSSANVEELCKALRAQPGIIMAEPNYICRPSSVPNDAYYTNQAPDFSLIGVEQAWDVQPAGASSIKVAVIDTGVDTTHEDLAPVLDTASGYDFYDNEADADDDNGHGTRVAGIIGAVGNNAKGIAGIAHGVTVIPYDVANPSGDITVAHAISALSAATEAGANVINMSFGTTGYSSLFETACSVSAQNALLVAGAGNEGRGDTKVYPAAFASVMGVAATADGGTTRAEFSNFNELIKDLVDLAAPGETVFSCISGSDYNGTFGSGTSFSAPMVSGVAALLQTKHPTQSPGAIRAHLKATATSLGNWAGSGLLSAEAALETPMAPAIEIVSTTVDDHPSYDTDNDGDGALDKNETAKLIVTLKSTAADGQAISATLATADPDIGIIADPSATYGPIAHSAQVGNTAEPFAEIAVGDVAAAKTVAFTLSVADASGYNADLPLTLPIENETAIGGMQIGQTFNSDTTYHVTSNLLLRGVTTIEPGTTFKIDPAVDVRADAGCELSAVGAEALPIRFIPSKPLDFNASIGPRTEEVPVGTYQVVRYVSASTGSDSVDSGTKEDPWKSIAFALSQITDASDSHRYAVLVAEGMYVGDAIPVVAMKSHIDLFGGFESSNWTRDIITHPSTINGEDNRQCIAGADFSRIDGFTIMRGFAVNGAGIRCYQVSPTITNCLVIQNKGNSGSGIWCSQGSAAVIRGCRVVSNGTVGSGTGGGVLCRMSSPTITDCVIAGNNSSRGGGIFCDDGGKPLIANCVIAANSTNTVPGGGGIYCKDGAEAEIINCTIAGNNFGGQVFTQNSPVKFTNSVIWDNEYSSGLSYWGDTPPTLNSCNINGGWTGPGTQNINADPQFAATSIGGQVIDLVYDDSTMHYVITVGGTPFPEDSLVGQIIQMGTKAVTVLSNTSTTITVEYVHNLTNILPMLPMEGTVMHYQILPSSPNRGAGVGPTANPLVPTADIDNDPRSGITCDIGADQYSVNSGINIPWGHLWITSSASNATLQHAIVEGGAGILSENYYGVISNVVSQYNTDYGMRISSPGMDNLSDCTVTGNHGPGIDASLSNLVGCVAEYNGGGGLIGAALTDCTAFGNGGNALTGASATDCSAEFNGGDGAVLSGPALRVVARDNRGDGVVCSSGDVTESDATLNGGVGMRISGGGMANMVYAAHNGSGGIVTDGSTVSYSSVDGNTGVGITGSGSSTVSFGYILNNSGAAISGVATVEDSAISGNGSGVANASTISTTYIVANSGDGVAGGAIRDCSIIANTGNGINSLSSLSNSWIVRNDGLGILSSDGLGAVRDSTIWANAGIGVKNILSLTNSNILENEGAYQASDMVTGSGMPDRNFTGNWWGSKTTDLDAHGEFWNHSFLQDTLDGSGSWLIDVWPYATSEVASAPDATPPAFLLSVTPNLDNATNVGVATFLLTFSKAMDQTVLPVVTFDLTTPYTGHVVEPAPGGFRQRSGRASSR